MGGRGSSSTSSARVAAPSPQAQAIDDSAPISTGTHTLAEIQAMTDSEFEAYLSSIDDLDMPNFLAGNGFQRFVYDADVNSKPQVVDQATFDSMGGQVLYRTVNSVYDRRTDVNMRADQIAQQTMYASLSRVGDGVYGDGYYFADTRRASTAYGSTTGDVRRTAVMQAKIAPTARVVDYKTIRRQFNRSGIDMAVPRMSYDSQLSAYATHKGYNVIKVGNGYYNILDRSALVFSSNVTAM